MSDEKSEVKIFPEGDEVKHDEAIDAFRKGRGE